jgi:hypothetical protein
LSGRVVPEDGRVVSEDGRVVSEDGRVVSEDRIVLLVGADRSARSSKSCLRELCTNFLAQF